jgi:hypothetical protein
MIAQCAGTNLTSKYRLEKSEQNRTGKGKDRLGIQCKADPVEFHSAQTQGIGWAVWCGLM